MSTHGKFAWFELVTTDVPAGVAFWSEVGGLTATSMPMPGGGGDYPMLGRAGATFAGVTRPQMPGVPNHWLSYWGVDDVDARAAAVPGAGGQVIVPPMDIPSVGRFSLVADPTGATIALFRSASGAPEPDSTQQNMGWVELWTPDAAKAVAFYTRVLGLAARAMEMPSGPYHVLSIGGVDVAGVMTSADPKIPSMWLPYLVVESVDEAAARVRAHGGVEHVAPMSVPRVGRFGVYADRQQAVLGLLTPDRG